VLRRIELEVLHSRPWRHDLRARDEARPQRELPLSCRRRPRRKGVVYTERDGRRKRVVPSDARAVERYQDLVRQHSHIDFPELLTGRRSRCCTTSTSRELSPRSLTGATTTATRSTVSSSGFRDRGLVGTADGHYEFNADFDRLHEFAREIAHHLHRHRLEAVAPKGTILWEDYDEFLAQAETEIDAEAFHETGLARFAAFDLQFLLTDHRYYVYSEEPDAVSPAELCCHTLLIDDGSRHRSYCLLLLSHVDIDEEDLREQAVKYGLEDVIDALLQYLETQGEVEDDRLLAWSEFQKLAGEYEIER